MAAIERNPELIFSARECRSIPDMVSAGETVVVCGVWQETTIKRYSATVGPTGRVVFIEANPDNVKRLKKLTHDMDHVTWINRAVWSEKAEVQFVRSLNHRHSWNHILDARVLVDYPYDKVERWEEITAQADTIDNVMSELGIGRIDHLNLTVNRSEFEALEGARQIIASSPNMRLRLNSCESQVAQMEELLTSMGFIVYLNTEPQVVKHNKGAPRYRIYAVKRIEC